METEDKYTIAIGILSILLFISVMIIIIGIKIIKDLDYTIEMHKNTIGVCNIDLKQVQEENEDLRNNCIRK